MFLFLDPLLQFSIYKILNIPTIAFIFIFIILIFISIQFEFLKKKTINSIYHIQWNKLYQIVQSAVYGNIIVKKQLNFPTFYFLFIVILLSNVIGLIPFAFTVTSSFIITIFFSLILFLIVILTAIYYNDWRISNLFLPEDVPLLITPGIILIEVISFFARVLSLSIRLFANMMSGHALMKILSGFAWILFTSTKFNLIIISLIPWLIVTIVIFLEALIAFLQAYVFLTLSTIYLNDVINMH